MSHWTFDELSLLKRMAAQGKSFSEAAEALDRSRDAIRQKALELGVRLSRSRSSTKGSDHS
jgi:hypothetical protein